MHGNYECLAFLQPCKIKEGDKFTGVLRAFFTSDIMLTANKEFSARLVEKDGLAQVCTAQVVKAENALVRIGNIFIILDEPIPKGIQDGSIIEFSCDRLDLYPDLEIK